MRIIFLDVDGVLNSQRNVIVDGGYPFPNIEDNPKHNECNLDRLAIGLVRDLCSEFNAKIVMHSTWRVYIKDAELWGIRHNLPVVDMTDPKIGKPESIKKYLAEHQVEDYIVIDDDEMYQGDRQIWTNPSEGFIYRDYNRVQKKFIGV